MKKKELYKKAFELVCKEYCIKLCGDGFGTCSSNTNCLKECEKQFLNKAKE